MVDASVTPLFVPATMPQRFAKAAASSADAVILDLEDAVAAAEKDNARSAINSEFTSLPVIVRVNGIGTPWHEGDLAAMRDMGFAALMLPKSESAAAITQVVAAVPTLPIIALIETALGLANAREIARIQGVTRLAFGSVDFCADLGCAHLREVLLPARSELVLASRLAGIAPPIDGVTVELDDARVAFDDASHAQTLGMTGKLCVHPKQTAEVKRAFTPSEAEVSWAQRILNSGDGAVSVDGAMIDEPVRIRARAILARVTQRF